MNVTLPNGKVIPNVPEGTSKEEIRRVAILNNLATEEDFVMAGTSTDVGAVVKPDANLPSEVIDTTETVDSGTPQFLQNIGAKLSERGERISEDVIKYETGQISFPELAVAGIGETAGGFMDTVGETVIAGLGELPFADYVKAGAEATFDAIMETDVGKEGLEAIKGGMEEWQKFSAENPRISRQISSVLNVAALTVKLPKLKKDKDKVPFYEKMKKSGSDNLSVKIYRSFEDMANDKVLKKTKKAKEGIIDLNKINPMEKKAINSLKILKGFHYDKSPSANLDKITARIDKLRNEISTDLKKYKGLGLKVGTISDDFTEKSIELLDDAVDAEKLGASLKKVESKMYEFIGKYSKNGKIDAEGMWAARKDLDEWFNRQSGKADFETRGELSDAVYAARDAMNGEIKRVVKGIDKKFDNTSGLLYAQEGVAKKSAAEIKEKVGGIIRTFESIGFRGRALSVLVSGLGLDAALLLAGNPAVVAGSIAAAIVFKEGVKRTGRYTGKLLNREKLGELLGMLDSKTKQVRKIGDNKLLKQLKATRSTLITLAKDTGVFDKPREAEKYKDEGVRVAP